MLHAKIQEQRTSSSGEDFFKALKVLTIYWGGGHIGHVTWTICTNYGFPFPRTIHTKLGLDCLSGFREDL